ncbi:MAG: hypothetical protein U5L09_07235 [Bacteroidales bacterium]|nr:hypothetical protein [Bacteroidales bacterium]
MTSGEVEEALQKIITSVTSTYIPAWQKWENANTEISAMPILLPLPIAKQVIIFLIIRAFTRWRIPFCVKHGTNRAA